MSVKPLRFIVIADSHIRFPDDELDAYPSNALMVLRNRHVVELCNRIDAAFVVHLGDIVHPLPVETGHEAAVRLAGTVYEDLSHPIHFVAGNHDVGDKPNSLVAVPAVAPENYEVFERCWGTSYRSFDVEDCHFVILDTPVLNSGFDREIAQRAWFEQDLTGASDRRIFVFTHYPPFIRDRAEDEHYDNLGEPARTWLLDLIEDHDVEAVFSGHVHNFLYNHHAGSEFYVVPATGFVRPDYAELAAIAPLREGGRDDTPKLGFFVVDVTPDGHDIRPIRTLGQTIQDDEPPVPLSVSLLPGWHSPIGVTLRHGWASVVAFPTAGLDEFNRKTVRNDAVLAALWEARIADIRVPVADVGGTEGMQRLLDLTGRGMRFTVRSAGVPVGRTVDTIASLGDAVVRWEVVATPDTFEQVLTTVADSELSSGLLLAIAPIVPLRVGGSSVHHFVSSGFAPGGDEALRHWLELDSSGVFGDLVFRAEGEDSLSSAVGLAAETAADADRSAVVNVELPRRSESRPFVDDRIVADRVGEAVAAACEQPAVSVFLDGFVDHDRSYYPRHGLIDRRYNPRPALHRLIIEAARS